MVSNGTRRAANTVWLEDREQTTSVDDKKYKTWLEPVFLLSLGLWIELKHLTFAPTTSAINDVHKTWSHSAFALAVDLCSFVDDEGFLKHLLD